MMKADTNTCNRRFVAYRGLMALNNLGVGHLEKGRYPEAMKALKGALVLHHAYSSSQETTEQMSAMISRMTTSPSVPHHTPQAYSENKYSSENESMRFLDHNGTIFQPLTVSTGTLVNFPSSILEISESMTTMVAFPLCVEVQDFDLDPSEDSLDLQTAFILHNLATTSLCACLDTAFAGESQPETPQIHSLLLTEEGRRLFETAPISIDKARRICSLFQAALKVVELICVKRMSLDGAYGFLADARTLEVVILTSLIPLMNLASTCPRDGQNFEPLLRAAKTKLAGLREGLMNDYEMITRHLVRQQNCAGAA